MVYLNPANEAERDALFDILAPHSWGEGEFGLMLTDAAFKECVESLPKLKENAVSTFLERALELMEKTGAGDLCVNFGVTG